MEEKETNHHGASFVDYFPPVQELAKLAGQQTRFARFPIRDMSIPTHEQMREILDAIQAEIRADGAVYVHCWGGKGRTGMVIGCHLLEMGMENQPGDSQENFRSYRPCLQVLLADAPNGRAARFCDQLETENFMNKEDHFWVT